MISLPFCFQCQTVLLGKNSNRALISIINISSVFISLKTSLMQTPDSQQCCSEEIGSPCVCLMLRLPSTSWYSVSFPFCSLLPGCVSSNTLATRGCCWAAGSLGARLWCCATCPQLTMAFPRDPWLCSAGATLAALEFLSNLIQCLLVIDKL